MNNIKEQLELLKEDLIKYTKENPKRYVQPELMILRIKDILKNVEEENQ